MTPHRANNSGIVSDIDMQSNDPGNYVILADNDYSVDPDGLQNNLDYNNGSSAQSVGGLDNRWSIVGGFAASPRTPGSRPEDCRA